MAVCHNEQSGFAEDWLHLGRAQASLALLSVCTVFRVSNSVTNRSASRTQRARFYLHSAEVKPALAAKQQQYAPSFSLSAPCILLTLTRRLRFISNPYFDTPSSIDQTLIGHQASGRLLAYVMQHASRLTEGVAGHISEEQDADRSGQDARKHHFRHRKRPGESNDRFGFKGNGSP